MHQQLNEAQTRYNLIDPLLTKAGWNLADRRSVHFEVPVDGYDASPINGITDYCLFRSSGEVLAVIEAKRTRPDAQVSKEKLYQYLTEIETRQAFAFVSFNRIEVNEHIQAWFCNDIRKFYYSMAKLSLHPFPARMAPELAFETINLLQKNAVVLDPMSGSGTSLHIAAKHGCKALGRDVEPLALLLSGIWNVKFDFNNFLKKADSFSKRIVESPCKQVPWFDEETKQFADYWFAEKQQNQLNKIASVIVEQRKSKYYPIYLAALSRCIITKDKGASLARDVSHAKPHKVRDENDYDVWAGFSTNLKLIANQLSAYKGSGKINVKADDARELKTVPDKSIDCIITSPPYLNAVDYFRGHRLSLIWMGYTINEIRQLRAKSIGLEKQPDDYSDPDFVKVLFKNAGDFKSLPLKKQKYIERYALDMYWVCKQWHRTLRKNRKATVVIADSYSSGIAISSTQLIKNAARLRGLDLINEKKRDIPAGKRYLPPPEFKTGSALDNRMKIESVLTFIKR